LSEKDSAERANEIFLKRGKERYLASKGEDLSSRRECSFVIVWIS